MYVYLQKVCALVSHVRGRSMLYGLTGVPFALATIQASVPRLERYVSNFTQRPEDQLLTGSHFMRHTR